jgi:VanZ family protein
MQFTNDKKKHLGVSFALGSATGAYMKYNYQNNSYAKNLLIGTGIAMIPGVLKEFRDSTQPNNHISSADLAYDLLGSVAGTMFGIYISEEFFIDVKQRKIAYNIKF